MNPDHDAFLKEIEEHAKEHREEANEHFKRVISSNEDVDRLDFLNEKLSRRVVQYSLETDEVGRQFRAGRIAHVKNEIEQVMDQARLQSAWDRIEAKSFVKDTIIGGVKKLLPLAKDLALKYGLEFAKDIGGVL